MTKYLLTLALMLQGGSAAKLDSHINVGPIRATEPSMQASNIYTTSAVVPAIEVKSDAGVLCFSLNGWEPCYVWTCADKSQVLMTTEAGGKFCVDLKLLSYIIWSKS